MKERKGFTLIELLALIVILSIIVLISVPIVISLIEKAKTEIFIINTQRLIDAGKVYYSKQFLVGSDLLETKTFKVVDGKWDGDGLSVNGSLPSYGIILIDKKGRVAIATSDGKLCAIKYFLDEEISIKPYSEEECTIREYKEVLLNGAVPELANNMIPVVISNSGEVMYADIYSDWYEYGEKEWANAVVVEDKGRLDIGDIIEESNILAYFVWIPRYQYQLFNVNGKSPGGPMEVQVVFEDKETIKLNGSVDGNWLTHPSFIFGNKELNGYWVGKFETGYQQGNLTDIITWTTVGSQVAKADTDGSKIVIKPNIPSWRNMNVSNMFNTTRSMGADNSRYGFEDNDPHLMKNIEWGAVAYLSHSKYGKNGEININNCSNYITGIGDANKNASSSSATCTAAENKWNGTIGKQASTTGNITGIYDMSGGALEYLSGVIQQNGNSNINVGSSDFKGGTDVGQIDNETMLKYFDKYEYSANWYHRSRGILGDATIELGPWSDTSGINLAEGDNATSANRSSWYIDYASFPHTSYSWFSRGGSNFDSASAGIFMFNQASGAGSYMYSFRIVVLGN